ncbi:MAG: hypothetical protein JW883_15065 [Deltaproteobacteria bacterium]|nr:hypothetical protein [Deltaproteobacteria bacterium]
MKKAGARAIADHKRTGDPIVVWDGSAVKIPAEQIEIREPGPQYFVGLAGLIKALMPLMGRSGKKKQ